MIDTGNRGGKNSRGIEPIDPIAARPIIRILAGIFAFLEERIVDWPIALDHNPQRWHDEIRPIPTDPALGGMHYALREQGMPHDTLDIRFGIGPRKRGERGSGVSGHDATQDAPQRSVAVQQYTTAALVAYNSSI